MQAPRFVRLLTAEEQAALEAGLHSAVGVTVRRCHMLLASAAGQTTTTIARTLHCNEQTVRTAIHSFHARGLAALQPGSSRPHTDATIFHAARREQLRALLHQSPRTFGKPTSIWTLELAAEISVAEGITPQVVSDETIRNAIHALGISWKRAKHWITSPDPEYARNPPRRDRLIRLATNHPSWAIAFADEVWWRRLAQPEQHAWVADDDLLRLEELERAKDDRDPKALAWYGMLLRRRPTHADQMVLRFVSGRPVSAVTTAFLSWCSTRLAAQGITGLFLVGDNASWHKSQHVRSWIRAHNREVKRSGQGVRFIPCLLPSKSPWLNPIEPNRAEVGSWQAGGL